MILDAQAGDVLTVGAGLQLRTGEIMWLFPDRTSALVCWHDSGRTTRLWPGADARIQHRELAELEVPEPRGGKSHRPTPTQTTDKAFAGAPHPALR